MQSLLEIKDLKKIYEAELSLYYLGDMANASSETSKAFNVLQKAFADFKYLKLSRIQDESEKGQHHQG